MLELSVLALSEEAGSAGARRAATTEAVLRAGHDSSIHSFSKQASKQASTSGWKSVGGAPAEVGERLRASWQAAVLRFWFVWCSFVEKFKY